MGVSTFSGPIKAGPIKFTTGITLGTDVADLGFMSMTQYEAISQVALTDTTDIVIPAGSIITDIKLYVTSVWTGTTTLGVGTSVSAIDLTAANAVSGAALGLIVVTPGADAGRVAKWANVGTTDIRIVVTSAATGTGTGYLAVTYAQTGILVP